MSRNEAIRACVAFAAAALGIGLLILLFGTIAQVLSPPAVSLIAIPALTFAKVAPAFTIGGILQPRHPLVVGFVSGFVAIALINGKLNQPHFEIYSMLGEALSGALISGVSMFAGRQFARLRRAT